VKEFVAIGGGAASNLWCQIMADATGRSIRRSARLEASSLGAAVCAAVGAGLYETAAEAAGAMSGRAFQETNPSRDNRAIYADLLGIYRELYPGLRRTFAKLAGRAAT
jgi:xylulokinase